MEVKIPMSTKKTERLQLRLSPEEKEMLMKKAAESRMTVSDYLANLVATEPLPPKGGRFNQRLKPPKVG